MLIGIGTDILSRERLKRGLDRAFILRTYTPAEQAQGEMRTDPAAYYATRFAAKEAVYKAVSVSGAAFEPREIETLDDECGRPSVRLSGETARRVREYAGGGEYRILVSLSYEDTAAIAFAAAEV